MVANIERGWLAVPGIRENADRTLADQMLGLPPALAECRGKTVLDIGCAEGLIGLEFAKAGATRVVGLEWLQPHLDVAYQACKGYDQMEFVCADLKQYIPAHPDPEQYDIVLALGICHKLRDTGVPLLWAAKSAKDLLVFRGPRYMRDGWMPSKHYRDSECHVPTVMEGAGFAHEQTIRCRHGECVEYWRRVR